MTQTKKIAVSLPAELVASAQAAVREGRAPSVSAYVAQALASRQESDTLTQLVSQMRAEDGTPTEEDYAWADAVLGLPR